MNTSWKRRLNVSTALWMMGSLLAAVLIAGADPATEPGTCCSASSQAASAPARAKPASPDLAAKWGIEVSALRLSANGNIIDFRYKVLDPEKAAVLGSEKVKPKLIDQETGAQLHVPSMPKVGQLRSTTQRLVAGKIYTALFSNPGGVVKKGHKVTVVFGDFRAEDLTVVE